MTEVKTAYVTIGNTDNRLTQQEWSAFCVDLSFYAKDHARQIFFLGHSPSDTPWQNMCVCMSINEQDVEHLRTVLKVLAHKYRQDSIALAVVDRAELIKP